MSNYIILIKKYFNLNDQVVRSFDYLRMYLTKIFADNYLKSTLLIYNYLLRKFNLEVMFDNTNSNIKMSNADLN